MMGDLPSIQQLECFIIYGRVQNFTRAAKEANITQSAFSAQMKNLESALGVTLIQRSKRGSHLTEAGKVFLARITDWMDGLHKIVYDLQSANAAQPAELNVGILRTLREQLVYGAEAVGYNACAVDKAAASVIFCTLLMNIPCVYSVVLSAHKAGKERNTLS